MVPIEMLHSFVIALMLKEEKPLLIMYFLDTLRISSSVVDCLFKMIPPNMNGVHVENYTQEFCFVNTGILLFRKIKVDKTKIEAYYEHMNRY